MLAHELRAGRLALITGAGVTRAMTSQAPSWPQLLRGGLAYAQRSGATATTLAIADEILQAESPAARDMIVAAEEIVEALKDRSVFRDWVRSAFGQLRAETLDMVHALAAFKSRAVLATTNYDTVLSDALGVPTASWRLPARCVSVLRGDHQQNAILHLHGVWDDIDSIILTESSYDGILADSMTQFILRVLAFTKTILFVGMGDGLTDPNFDTLCRWLREHSSAFPHRHYRLCLADDVSAARVSRRNPIRPVIYGHEYNELAPFLVELVRAAGGEQGSPAPADPNPPWHGSWLWNGKLRQATLWTDGPRGPRMMVYYERRGLPLQVELSLTCEASAGVLRLQSVRARYLDASESRKWLLDAFELQASPDGQRLEGFKWELEHPDVKVPVAFRRSLGDEPPPPPPQKAEAPPNRGRAPQGTRKPNGPGGIR